MIPLQCPRAQHCTALNMAVRFVSAGSACCWTQLLTHGHLCHTQV